MKLSKIFLPLLIFTGTISFAQNKLILQKVDESKSTIEENYIIDARPLLDKFYKANGIDLQKLAKQESTILRKTTGPWNFTVGSTRAWKAQDLTTNGFYDVPSTCRAVSAPEGHCYIFVEDSSWTNGRVDQNAVNQILNAFDNSTPINSSKGVYQNTVDTFGNPADVDGDPKIIILILNIRDGFKGSGGFTAGYFTGLNESLSDSRSNKAEFYYMDCNPLNLKTQTGSNSLTTALQITAHEFQHMIHWNYKDRLGVDDPSFFDEGCSMIAEVVNGYPLRLQSSYSNTTNTYLENWTLQSDPNYGTLVLSDYARAARFFLYIKEQFGAAALGKYVQSTLTAVNAFNISVFPSLGTSRRFDDVVTDWWVANYLNDKNVDAKFGYDYANVPQVTSTPFANPNVSNYSSGVYKQAVQYFTYSSGKNLNIPSFTTSSSSIKLKLIKVGPNGKQVVDLTPPYTNISVPDFGTTYTNVTLMVYHNNRNEFSQGPFAYSYTSSGTSVYEIKELVYATAEPTGTGGGSDKDTTVIYFNGFAGAKLDSIKVAMRQAGSMQGAVYSYTGVQRPTPLGQKIAGSDFTATSNIATRPPSPYPPVWSNWVKIDLTKNSPKVDVSNTFAISFVNNGDYTATTGNGIMLTSISGTDTHSYIYLHKPGGTSTPNWYVLTDQEGVYTEFLVKAYISYGGSTGVEKVIELMPASFSLNQNYPNPFNPSTVISYQLPVAGQVSLKVFDMLGREVAVLVDEFQNAGKHNSQFSILNSQLSSGIYFYTIRAGDFVETKKMVLMK